MVLIFIYTKTLYPETANHFTKFRVTKFRVTTRFSVVIMVDKVLDSSVTVWKVVTLVSDDDDDDVMLMPVRTQVFLSHRSIYLLLFDLRRDLSATPRRPTTSAADVDVSRDEPRCWRISGYRGKSRFVVSWRSETLSKNSRRRERFIYWFSHTLAFGVRYAWKKWTALVARAHTFSTRHWNRHRVVNAAQMCYLLRWKQRHYWKFCRILNRFISFIISSLSDHLLFIIYYFSNTAAMHPAIAQYDLQIPCIFGKQNQNYCK